MYCSSRRNQLTRPYPMNYACGVMSLKGVFWMLVQYSRIQSPIDIIPFSLKSVCSYANMSPDYIRKIYMNAKANYRKSIVRSSLLSALLDKILGRYND